MRALTLAALAVLGAACASPPLWVRRTPVLKLVYRPWGTPFLEHPKFSFEARRSWKGPEFIEGGVRYRAPRGSARMSVAYHVEGAEGWKPPAQYRKWMREQGSTEDMHFVDTVEISSRAASRVVFTTHEYDPEYLLGARKRVLRSEVLMLPDEQGIFVIRYEGERGDYERHRPVFLRMLKTMALAVFETPKEE